MTSSEDASTTDHDPATKDDIEGFKPKTLEEIREEHGLGDEWTPRFAADTPIAEQKAEDYRDLGYDAQVFPHPDDVGRGQMPGRGDRCVVYTRPRESGEDEDSGVIDDDLL